MAKVQLLLNNADNERVLASLIEDRHETASSDDVEAADLYFVDEVSLSTYETALLERKRRVEPIFCPVVLLRREQVPMTLGLPDPASADPPLLVNDILRAPITRPELSRTMHNLLSRREETTDLVGDLRERNERLTRFSRALTHELRNPLQLLSGYLDIAEETGSADAFERCESAVERMEAMIDDTLLILREDDPRLEREAVTIPELCEDCWSGDEGDTAHLVIESERAVRGDPDQLKRLFENLFRNAIEHNATDVTITVGDLDARDGFFVEDDGAGIGEEIRDDVFEEGFSDSGTGTGLGLSVVRSIVDAHGWEVRVTDGRDGGARFEITGVEPAA